jgi:hypothetical protein
MASAVHYSRRLIHQQFQIPLTMIEQFSFNYLAILVATISTFLLGGLWYSPALFSKAWIKEMGITAETHKTDNKSGLGRIMGTAFVLELVMAFNLAAFIGPKASFAFGTLAGAAAGFGWVAMSFGVTYLFEQRSLRLFLINAGYHGIAFTIMGAIIGSWH